MATSRGRMIIHKTITCFIPAKGNSTRLTDKNLRICNGSPLVWYPYHIAKECKIFDNIVLSTENPIIACTITDEDLLIHARPNELATVEADVWDAVRHWIKQNYELETDYLCLLHPTSPCLKAETVITGIRMMIEAGHESLISVTKVSPYCFGEKDRPDFSISTGTQFEEEHFVLNNAIHVVPWEKIANGISIYATDWIWYPIPSDEGIDIDNETDLRMAEAVLQWRQHENKESISKNL